MARHTLPHNNHGHVTEMEVYRTVPRPDRVYLGVSAVGAARHDHVIMSGLRNARRWLVAGKISTGG